ncbi:hypothetical protein BO82DRAFT_359013 [Aspergillus uvarum CBS 121591]|uniref:Uncharacterized protein n=1 Tax=Aspergillus uvarum CBS 121591 TaxID=1448315 RepID=A0A319BYQ2_9EURO|nr:hypothetical protein BO82DRAFT_359013 [Aspergillus uvarum CBS 121591]PYH76590.1 hypothetical protein BO82DRAFT_359013 [Aspergillus uvarum CBS 121591]
MYTAALLLAFSLTAQSVPVFHSQANETIARRNELPYKVVDVAGTAAPTVETITATPSPPVTVTVTDYPSSTPAMEPFPFSSWSVGPRVTGIPHPGPQFAARALNSTEHNHRRHEHANTTLTEIPASQDSTTVAKRSNDTVPRSLGKHNGTEHEQDHHAEHKDEDMSAKALTQRALTGTEAATKHTGSSANETQPARVDIAPEHAAAFARRALTTDAKHTPQNFNNTAEQSDATKRALNTTEAATKPFARSVNGTSLHARNVTAGDY